MRRSKREADRAHRGAVTSDQNLYKNVANVATIVTGIDVAAGKTLTLPENYSGNAQFSFDGDVRNAGKLKTKLLGDMH